MQAKIKMDSLLIIIINHPASASWCKQIFFSFMAELFRLNLLAENFFLSSAMNEYTTFTASQSHFYALIVCTTYRKTIDYNPK